MNIINLGDMRKKRDLLKLLKDIKHNMSAPINIITINKNAKQIKVKSREVIELVDKLINLDLTQIPYQQIENLKKYVAAYNRFIQFSDTENITYDQPVELLDKILNSLKIMIQEPRHDKFEDDEDKIRF